MSDVQKSKVKVRKERILRRRQGHVRRAGGQRMIMRNEEKMYNRGYMETPTIQNLKGVLIGTRTEVLFK